MEKTAPQILHEHSPDNDSKKLLGESESQRKRIETLENETEIIERYLKFLDESFTWLKKYSNDPQIQQWIVNQYELLNVRIKNNKAALNPLSNGE